jgi:predicted nucleotidyltransferase
MALQIDVAEREIARFCRDNGIRRLALFGSVLRADFSPESDIDVWVEFEPGLRVGMLRMAALERGLAELLDRKVDLRTPAELSRYFREEVLRNSEILYGKG